VTTSPTEPTGEAPDADAAVIAGLRALSGSYPDLPSSVADRLDRTLAELPELTAADTTPPAKPASRVPWWRRRFALATAMTAAVVALAGLGLLTAFPPWADSNAPSSGQAGDTAESGSHTEDQLKSLPSPDDDSGSDQAGIEGEREPGYPVTFSGRDYTARTLAEAADPSTADAKSSLDTSLNPLLNDTVQRDGCVATILAAYTGTVSAIDFGSFDGAPAMLAVIDDADGGNVVVAVGAGCDAQHMNELSHQEL
jgi:hypothetical protein